jgi:hypothetical protein
MASFATLDLAQAWSDRSLELKLNRLKQYAGIERQSLVKKFTAERADINHRLHECVAKAKNLYDLVIPIYTFHYGNRSRIQGDLHWMSTYALVKHTDLCQQLAVFFGKDNFWVSWRKHGKDEYQLLLNYYPGGLPEDKALALQACAERHPPATPPRRTNPARAPPPVVRRKAADMSDSPHGPVTMAPPPPAYLRPSHCYAGTGSGGFIREYDSMEAAGRDFGRDLAAELEEEDAHRDCATCLEAAGGWESE